jgi:hypothetical protein
MTVVKKKAVNNFNLREKRRVPTEQVWIERQQDSLRQVMQRTSILPSPHRYAL